MDAQTRKEKLLEIQSNTNNIEMSGARLRYKGETTTQNVYKIPLEYLIYNKYNGRIGTDVKSYEKQYYQLNPENQDHKKIIEKFLYESKIERNEKTMNSLIRDRQQRYGIVTADGIIIDGNRRAFLLNKIFSEREQKHLSFAEVEHCQYFLAIILPEDATEKDIQQLETIYQMGEDDKLDYNPIEKYLKCADLRRLGFTTNDIADFMNEKPAQITKWLSILKLMEDYLSQFGYQGIYTRLEKTEGPFVDLNGYLDSYINKTATTRYTDWAYEESDISDLKVVCFDYIRARYEGKEFREIAKTGVKGSIFASEQLWKNFLDEHVTKVPTDEKSIEELVDEEPEEDLSIILRRRDDTWRKKALGPLEGNLKKYTYKLDDLRNLQEPAKLLEKARDILLSVDTSIQSFYGDNNIVEYVKDINSLSWDMKKLLDRNRK